MYHYFFQEGSLPGLGTFGGGQIIETDEAMTTVLSIKPLFSPPPPPPPLQEEGGMEAGSWEPQFSAERGKKGPSPA